MNKLKIAILVLALSSTNLFAQEKNLKDIYTKFTTAVNSALLTQTGSIEISGFMSYNYLKTKFVGELESSQSIILLEPQISYFILDNISLGMALSHSYSKTNYKGILVGIYPTEIITKQTFVGPIAKMYIGEEEFRPFVFADYLFMTGDQDGGEVDFGAGIFYHLTGNFGINLVGKYGIISTDQSGIDSQNRFFVGIGISNFIL